jgi:hypothetical protein
MIAARAFPLGLENNPIIHKINHSTSRGIHIREKITEIVRNSHTILKISHMRATVLLCSQ